MSIALGCIGGGVVAGLLLGLQAGDSIPSRPPQSAPVPAAAAPPFNAPASQEDALMSGSIGHSLARSSSIATLAECERLRAELQAGCRRYVREGGRPAPEARVGALLLDHGGEPSHQ